MKNTFNTDELYTRGEMINEDGMMVLVDMQKCLAKHNWNRQESIDYTAWNHGCSKENAAAKIDWALSVLKKK